MCERILLVVTSIRFILYSEVKPARTAFTVKMDPVQLSRSKHRHTAQATAETFIFDKNHKKHSIS